MTWHRAPGPYLDAAGHHVPLQHNVVIQLHYMRRQALKWLACKACSRAGRKQDREQARCPDGAKGASCNTLHTARTPGRQGEASLRENILPRSRLPRDMS